MLTACSALALAACGGGDGERKVRETVTAPKIERAVAERLAVRSDAVADLLDRGDNCGAAQEAARLRDEVTASISSIPELYVEDFSGLVNEIQAQIPPCEPPHDDEGGKDDGRKKEKRKRDEDGDD